MSGFSDVILYLAVANAAIFVLAAGCLALVWYCRRWWKRRTALKRRRTRVTPKDVDKREETLSPRPSSLASRKMRSLSEEALQVVTVSDVHSPRQEDVDESIEANIEGGEGAIVERGEGELEELEADDDDAEEEEDDDEMEEERALKARCEAFVEAKRDEWLNKVLERRVQPAPLEDLEDGIPAAVNTAGGDEAEQQDSQGATHRLQVPQEIDTSGLATNPRLRDFLAGDGAVYAQQGLDNFLPDRAGPPASPAAAFTGNLPPGWEMAFTPRGGTPYFWNEKTGESQWDPPKKRKKRRPPPGDVLDDSRWQAEDKDAKPLPEGWVKRWSPATSKVYYENRALRRVQHDRPQESRTSVSKPRAFVVQQPVRERVVVVHPPSEPASPTY